MRIGIYDPYLDDLGGGEKYMMTIAECLSQGNQVEIFWDNASDIDKVNKRFNIDLSTIKIVPNIFSPKVNPLKRILATANYDIIIVLSDGSIPFSLSKKLFLHLQQPLENFNSRSLKGKIKLSRVNAIFCNSEYTKTFNEKRFKIKTTVIYPPVLLSPKDIKKENIILTVGRFRIKDVVAKIDDYKKLPVMISVFKEMVKNGLKNWKFVMAVSVQDKDAASFDILKKDSQGFPIEFLVNKTNNELWEIYSKAKIYWHASGYGEDLDAHPELAEHFGISTVEAMGAGVVPVVINAGGQREIVENGENGLLWNNPKDLLIKTQSLIKDEKLMGKLSANAVDASKKFGKDRFCRQINELIS